LVFSHHQTFGNIHHTECYQNCWVVFRILKKKKTHANHLQTFENSPYVATNLVFHGFQLSIATEISFCLYFEESPKIVSVERLKPSVQAQKKRGLVSFKRTMLKDTLTEALVDSNTKIVYRNLLPLCNESHTQG
jgi:hypothetical protein